MNSGELRERVTLHFPAATVPNGIGGSSVSAPGATDEVWASVAMRKGKESLVEGKIKLQQEYVVKLRYRADVTTAVRLSWQELSLAITSLVSDAKQTEIVLYCVRNR
jgi:SPP1 family predicted phage head-tail adaptor